MGKVRVKTFGLPEEENSKKLSGAKSASGGKKEKREAKKMAKAPGLKGGERVVAVGPSEEEIEKMVSSPVGIPEENKPEEKKTKSKKAKFVKKKSRSQRYQNSAIVIDKSKSYALKEALELLAKFQKTKFDETVELHINTNAGGISGNITLPHGTGKITKVAVANDPSTGSGQVNLDSLIGKIESGIVDFDILIAHPNAMPNLAKVAKVLGPRGLMPNPKNGTITQKPEEVVKKFENGQMSYKTEAKAPLIHLTVGKFSFGGDKLKENIDAVVGAIKPENIQKVVLKSTMSPGIKVKA